MSLLTQIPIRAPIVDVQQVYAVLALAKSESTSLEARQFLAFKLEEEIKLLRATANHINKALATIKVNPEPKKKPAIRRPAVPSKRPAT